MDEVEFAAIEQRVLQYMRGLVSGEREARPMTLTFPPDVLREFWPFFESQAADWNNNRVCDLVKLAEILKTNPLLLWHPLVLRIIRHLRQVRRLSTDEVTRDGAEWDLRRLLEAAVSGLLGEPWGLKPPGWSLKPPPGRPGRKRDEYDEFLDDELRVGADYLKKSLQAGLRRRNERDSEDQRIRRVAALVKQVWEQSPFASEFDRYEIGTDDIDSKDIRFIAVPPPPADRIITWVRKAFDRRTEIGHSIESQLTWRVLAYRYDLSENAVRWRLDAKRRSFRRQ